MPEPDLVRYLDGEAEPVVAARIEAELRTDPRVRAEALALLRQQALLAVVLSEVRGYAGPRRRRLRPLLWLLPVAAAAGLMLAALVLLSGREAAPTPPPLAPVQSVTPALPVVVAAFAPGTTTTGSGQAIVLADGARILLSFGAQVGVPADGGAWMLQRGSLSADLPAGAALLRAGLRTTEAEIRPEAGRLEARSDEDGTQVLVAQGAAAVRDRLTGVASRAEPGRPAWIPADVEASREVAEAHGLLRGRVLSVEGNGRAVLLATRFGSRRLTPLWIGDGRKGQLDPAVRERLVALRAGDRVAVDWLWSEHFRIRALRVITDAMVTPAPAAGF